MKRSLAPSPVSLKLNSLNFYRRNNLRRRLKPDTAFSAMLGHGFQNPAAAPCSYKKNNEIGRRCEDDQRRRPCSLRQGLRAFHPGDYTPLMAEHGGLQTPDPAEEHVSFVCQSPHHILIIIALLTRDWTRRNDVATSIAQTDIFDFLVDIVPREVLPPLLNRSFLKPPS